MRATHENVKRIRAAKGISKTFVANKIGLSLQGYCHIENGAVKLSTERLRSVAQVLAEDISVFFNDELTDSVIQRQEILR